MVAAVFDCAYKLFGLKFIPRVDISAYHSDVKVYEVRQQGEGGVEKVVGVFLHGE